MKFTKKELEFIAFCLTEKVINEKRKNNENKNIINLAKKIIKKIRI